MQAHPRGEQKPGAANHGPGRSGRRVSAIPGALLCLLDTSKNRKQGKVLSACRPFPSLLIHILPVKPPQTFTFLLHLILLRQAPSAAMMVEELSTSLPGFMDQGLLDGQQLRYSRKAQALVAALRARFGDSDVRFAFSGAESLTADSGVYLGGAWVLLMKLGRGKGRGRDPGGRI